MRKLTAITTRILLVCAAAAGSWHDGALANQNDSQAVSRISRKPETIFHKRQRRYLIFEKGAAVVLQGNIAKAIIAGVPRGLNLLTEYSVMYELPTAIEMLSAKQLFNKIVAPPPPPPPPAAAEASIVATMPAAPPKYNLEPWQHDFWQPQSPQHHWREVLAEPQQQNWHRREHIKKHRNRKRLWCPQKSAGKHVMQRCRAQRNGEEPHRRAARRAEVHFDNVSERIFFDVFEKLAQMHGYNPRYCIMRTLCEARFLLLPDGHSLLHDVLRILLNYALPAAERQAAFKRSSRRANLSECAQLYGPHCRVSLLQHFTSAVHGVAAEIHAKPSFFGRAQNVRSVAKECGVEHTFIH